MAKATKTIRQSLKYPPQYANYFAANQALFNRVVAFYFDCIQAHEGILSLKNKQALTALEKLTHATASSPHPVMPLTDLACRHQCGPWFGPRIFFFPQNMAST